MWAITWLLMVASLSQVRVLCQSSSDPIAQACEQFPDNSTICLGGTTLAVCGVDGAYGLANCADRLFAIPPAGLKDASYCWPPPQGNTTFPNGDCALNGTAYPDNGTPFTIPASVASTSASPTSVSSTPTSITSAPSAPASVLSTTMSVSSTIASSSTTTASSLTTSPAYSSSASSAVSWSFIRPSVTSFPGCDIFGPLCQTGSITVEVNLTSTLTTTTMPCSSYLSAQSAYEAPLIAQDIPDVDYFTSFGRSPQCTSFAQSLSYSTYSQCNNISSTLSAASYYWPAGVDNNPAIPNELNLGFTCCGGCQVLVPQVRIFYWPSGQTNNCSVSSELHALQSSLALTSSMPLKRDHALLDNGLGIAVVSGYTFTSPTLYLDVVGTARVTDSCGQVGSVYTNPIIPVSALSTISYDVPVGSLVISDKSDPPDGITKTLNVADLACPTWGVESPNGGLLGYTVGPPFLPIIVPPPELLSLDPLWATCSYVGVANFIMSYGIFDPPYALQTVLDPVTSSQPITQPPALPASQVSPSVPSQTVWSPTTQTVLMLNPVPTPSLDPGVSNPAQSPVPTPSLDPGVSNPAQSPVSTPSIDPGASNQAQPPNTAGATINLGSLINSIFGASAPPTTYVIGSATLFPNGPGATLAGTPVSLAPSGILVVGTSSIPLASAASVAVGPQAYSVAPLPIDLNVTLGTQSVAVTLIGSTAAVVDGYTLVVGGSGVTVAGTPLSLAPGDTLLVGTAAVALVGTGGGTVTGYSQGVGQTGGVGAPFLGSASRRQAGWSVGGWMLLGCGWTFAWAAWGRCG